MEKSYDSIKFDLLKEVNNIGTGNALTSLSILINKKVAMQVPKIKFVEFNEVANVLGGADNFIIGVMSKLEGEIEGLIMFAVDLHSAQYLISNLLNQPVHEDTEFNKLELSVLTEISNIMFSTYCSSLNILTKKSVKSSVPFVSMDMAGAILSVPSIEYSKISDKVILVESIFAFDNVEICGYLIMVPDSKSFDVIINCFGVGV